jgi:uncharacterized Ntn-hydrolase superfamily protein
LIRRCSLLLLVLAFASSCSHQARLNTWTIVAADPKTGDVGVAGASCVPLTHVDAVAALVPGKGVAATQAFFDLENRNRVYELLRAGQSAEDVVKQVTNTAFDRSRDDRQYGIVTLHNGSAKIAAFTGNETLAWSGSVQDPTLAVTVQGNILPGPSVVADALRAFKEENALPERLMRALEAGSAAGGDSRCNNERVKQTAATAFILVARGGDSAYAARDLGVTDQSTKNAPWLSISVIERQFGRNPLVELRKKYDEWRKVRR